MRKEIKAIVVVGLLFLTTCAQSSAPQSSYERQGSVSIQLFYDQLSPYGMWVNYYPYGYVWLPDEWGFTPYLTSGNWVYTSYGWTWYSYYSWGWAPFHYGRWFYDSLYGWLWIPDTVWSPAWVAWSMSGDYCGWAPLGPGASVTVVVNGRYNVPGNHWIFVRDNKLSKRHIERYRENESRNYPLLERAQLVRDVREHDNARYIAGPDKNRIQKSVGKPITPVPLNASNRPGNGKMKRDELELYKPKVEKQNPSVHRTAPRKVFELEEVRVQQNENNNQNRHQLEKGESFKNSSRNQKGNVSRGNESHDRSPKQKKKNN